jgi:hypothetical protein
MKNHTSMKKIVLISLIFLFTFDLRSQVWINDINGKFKLKHLSAANGTGYCFLRDGNTLFLGGFFAYIGNVYAYRIGQYNGHYWSPLDQGL